MYDLQQNQWQVSGWRWADFFFTLISKESKMTKTRMMKITFHQSWNNCFVSPDNNLLEDCFLHFLLWFTMSQTGQTFKLNLFIITNILPFCYVSLINQNHKPWCAAFANFFHINSGPFQATKVMSPNVEL